MGWGELLFSLLTAALNLLLGRQRKIEEQQDRQDGSNETELEGHRELDRLNDIADAARDGVRDDIDSVRADPRNRRRLPGQGDPM
jgi:hypothetical protein